jgi:hypothetical protein
VGLSQAHESAKQPARLLAGPDGAADFGAFLDSELLGRLAADFAFHVEGAVLEHLVRDVDQGILAVTS